MSTESHNLYLKLEQFIKENTETHSEEEEFIKTLKELETIGYNRGRTDGMHYGYLHGLKRGQLVNSYYEFINECMNNSIYNFMKASIEKHEGNDEKIMDDIAGVVMKMISAVGGAASGTKASYTGTWLISVGMIRAIRDSFKSRNLKEELAEELVPTIDEEKITGKNSCRIILDDIIDETINTWTPVSIRLPNVGDEVEITFELNDRMGEKGTPFERATLERQGSKLYWVYKNWGSYKVQESSVKGWRYPKKSNEDWICFKEKKPPVNSIVEIRIVGPHGDYVSAKNVVVGNDGEHFDYSKSIWDDGRQEYLVSYGSKVEFYISAVTHWRYMHDNGHVWRRFADQMPPVNTWVEMKTDNSGNKTTQISVSYEYSVLQGKTTYYATFRDGYKVALDLTHFTQWRHI